MYKADETETLHGQLWQCLCFILHISENAVKMRTASGNAFEEKDWESWLKCGYKTYGLYIFTKKQQNAI